MKKSIPRLSCNWFSPNVNEIVSNFVFILLPPISMYLFRDYGHNINRGIHVIWALMIVIGIGSTYFHATLSLAGQLMDELSILWELAAVYALFFPKKIFPKWQLFSAILGVSVVIFTLLAFWAPIVNAFALVSLTIPSLMWVYGAVKREKRPRVHRLGFFIVVTTILAVTCWILDRFFCDTILGQTFSLLHAFWHILICCSSYSAIVLVAYYATRIPEFCA